MNAKRQKKLLIILSLLVILSVAAGLILYALKQNINLFFTPTELLHADVKSEQHFRLGGYVKVHSVAYDASGESVRFVVTDRKNEITVSYRGVLPNLFKEGQSVVVTGQLQDPTLFLASEVLAKHDEKYMPPSVARELKKGENNAA
jgi:cytochrome c-type biogenesis protein CcmE